MNRLWNNVASFALSFIPIGMFLCFLFLPFSFAFGQDSTQIQQSNVIAQENNNQPQPTTPPNSENPNESTDSNPVNIPKLEVIAGKDKNIVSGRKASFEAKESIVPEIEKATFEWDFGDGQSGQGAEITHIYDNPGEYIARLTITTVSGETGKDELIVSVYEDLILLVTDRTTSESQIAQLQRLATKQGLLIFEISDRTNNPDYVLEAQLTQELLSNSDVIKKSDIIITWTAGNSGLNILSQFAQGPSNLHDLDFASKSVVTITDQNFNVIARTAQSTFDILQPEYILLTRDTSINSIIDAGSSDRLINEMQGANIEYAIIGVHSQRAVRDLSIFNFMSYLVNFMVNKGIPINTITLILIFPIIATIIVLARQVVGLKSFGIYTPIIVTLSFLAIGLKYGLIIFLVILFTGTLVRFILKRFRFFYFPKMALVLTAVAFSLLLVLASSAYFDNINITVASFFPMLLMIIIVEKFISVQIEKGSLTALTLSVETLVLAILCYYILSWDYLRTLVINYPEIIIVTVFINIIIGRWTGLRFFEYLRFRELLKYIEE